MSSSGVVSEKPTRREMGQNGSFAVDHGSRACAYVKGLAMNGDAIRTGYTAIRHGVENRVIGVLERRGPCTTYQVNTGVSDVGYSELIETLARLVDDGKVVATRKPTTARGGRPGVIYRLA